MEVKISLAIIGIFAVLLTLVHFLEKYEAKHAKNQIDFLQIV